MKLKLYLFVLVTATVMGDAELYNYLDDDLYFEILHPEDIGYTYKIRRAKNFGTSFVSIWWC